MSGVAVCVDVGSTYTKAAAVDVDSGRLLATASHPTTVDTDVLDGLDAAVAGLEIRPSTVSSVDVCSSAGGGLRLAVIGYEELVTAEAGHRVGLSAGARVVHVGAGRLDRAGVDALRSAHADVVLLVGGTDGGDEEVLRHNADALARARLGRPVVVAGNSVVREDAVRRLGPRAVGADNVLPRIGDLRPRSARAAIRDVFLRHVIGGKGLSKGRRFASLVRGATPDIVLTAVELLADATGDDLVVVDVGGATTDVYSALSTDEGEPDVAGRLARGRTVEGDLGLRWSAPSVVTAAARERLLDPPSLVDASRGASMGAFMGAFVDAAARRAADPAFLPTDPDEVAVELRLTELAATIALRRHGRGRDLSRVRLLVGSGGVLRHHPEAGRVLLDRVLADHAGGWALPRAAVSSVDTDYVLAPAGLLAARHPAAALALLRSHLSVR